MKKLHVCFLNKGVNEKNSLSQPMYSNISRRKTGANVTSSTAHLQPDIPSAPSIPLAKYYLQAHHQLAEHSPQLLLQTMASLEPGDVTKAATKKPKTATPDGQKDATYWAKRNKNNLSARKSRESKRQHEIETRVKADNLKEENVALRKKIASIKKRHGLPLNISVMTKEETEQCMEEIKSLTLTGEVNHTPGISKDAASSTSTVVPHLAVQQTLDDSIQSPRETAASSTGRESVRNEGPSLNYGPSVYGPFNPSLSWPPVAMPPLYASSSILNYPPWAGLSRGSSTERELLEKSNRPQNYFVNKGMPGLCPVPYGYYVQYKSEKSRMYYSSSSDDDVAMNRSKARRKQKGASKGRFNDSLHERGVMTGGLSVSATPPFLSTTEPGSYMGGAAVDLSSSRHIQSQFSGPFKLPLPTAPLRNRHTQPAETTSSDAQQPFIDPEKAFLSQENAQLKGTIQTLMAEMTELKAAVHKDQPRGHP